MTAIPVLADRTCRARREGTCPACRGPILVGQYIARCPGRVWLHASCFVANGGHTHNSDGACRQTSTEEEPS
jgi:hypothetical protein